MNKIQKASVIIFLSFFLLICIIQKSYCQLVLVDGPPGEPYKILTPADIDQSQSSNYYTSVYGPDNQINLNRIRIDWRTGQEVDPDFINQNVDNERNTVIIDDLYGQSIKLQKKEPSDPDSYVTFQCNVPVHGTAVYLTLNASELFDCWEYPNISDCSVGTVKIKFVDEKGKLVKEQTEKLIPGINIRDFSYIGINFTECSDQGYIPFCRQFLFGVNTDNICSLNSILCDILKIEIEPNDVKYRIKDITIEAHPLKKIFTYYNDLTNYECSSTHAVMHGKQQAFYALLAIRGISIETDFECQNSAGNVAPHFRQHGRFAAYGGRELNNGIIGQHRTIGYYGCLLCSCAMLLRYYGYDNITPESLNTWLQKPISIDLNDESNCGYRWCPAYDSNGKSIGINGINDTNVNGVIDVGDTMNFTKSFEKSDVGQKPVIKRQGKLIGTVTINNSLNQGTISAIFNNAFPPSVTDTLGWYSHIFTSDAMEYTNDPDEPNSSLNGVACLSATGRTWSNIEIQKNLSEGYPVIFNVQRSNKGYPHHFVLGVGITPGWDIDPELKTYLICDPSKYNSLDQWNTNRRSRLTRTFLYKDEFVSYNNSFARGDLIRINSYSTPMFRVIVYSPVEIFVTDSFGNRTGIDPATLNRLSEIPHSFYDIEYEAMDDANMVVTEAKEICKIFEVFDPNPGNYSVNLIGVNSGEYEAVFEAKDGIGERKFVYNYGTTSLGQQTIYQVNFNPNNSSEFSADPIAPSSNNAPIACANGPYNNKVGVAISFDSSGSTDPDGDSLSFHWDFGDGADSTNQNPSHTYTTSGNHTVILTVSDGDLSATDSATVTISSSKSTQPTITQKNFLFPQCRIPQWGYYEYSWPDWYYYQYIDPDWCYYLNDMPYYRMPSWDNCTYYSSLFYQRSVSINYQDWISPWKHDQNNYKYYPPYQAYLPTWHWEYDQNNYKYYPPYQSYLLTWHNY